MYVESFATSLSKVNRFLMGKIFFVCEFEEKRGGVFHSQRRTPLQDLGRDLGKASYTSLWLYSWDAAVFLDW